MFVMFVHMYCLYVCLYVVYICINYIPHNTHHEWCTKCCNRSTYSRIGNCTYVLTYVVTVFITIATTLSGCYWLP